MGSTKGESDRRAGMSGFMDRVMEARGIGYHGRELAHHVFLQFKENVMSVVPISLLLILSMAIFFQRGTTDPGLQVMGLVCAIVGLVLFAEGLRVLIMPLGEMVGMRMPLKHSLPSVLAVAGVLGILVTYAEPAIAAILPLADLVEKETAPYLYFMLNQKQQLMVFSIGLGVGFAAIVGTLMFLKKWSMKPLIACFLTPTIAVACWMHWGNPDLRPLLGLAWDCGAVTTGPVTVPLLLALGIGVTRSEREKKRMRRSLFEAVTLHGTASSTLEGFGIVTLASLLPVLMVELMAVGLSLRYSKEHILGLSDKVEKTRVIDESPLKEVIYGFRAILPLMFGLLFIVKVILREPLPYVSIYLAHLDHNLDASRLSQPEVVAAGAAALDRDDDEDDDDADGSGGGRYGEKKSTAEDADGGAEKEMDLTVEELAAYDEARRALWLRHLSTKQAAADAAATDEAGEMTTAAAALAAAIEEGDAGSMVASSEEERREYRSLFEPDSDLDSELPDSERNSLWHRYKGYTLGYLMIQIGMILFNLGLTYGFSKLADQAGRLLPAAYLDVPYEEKSPFYTYAGGLTIVFMVVFMLGFLATRAEPALNVLGRTVETMSKGAFTRSQLIYAVCIGVGSGLVVGAYKILFDADLIFIILAKYAIACVLAYFVSEDFVTVAWDSAGVTTGPVTVPFVLSLGIGFSVAVSSAEGFGMLTAASVAPIIAVQFAKIFIFRGGKNVDEASGSGEKGSPTIDISQTGVTLTAGRGSSGTESGGGDSAGSSVQLPAAIPAPSV